MIWPERIKKFIFSRRKETVDRRSEWLIAQEYDERVRIVETDMKAITAFVRHIPSLKPPRHPHTPN